VHGLGSLAVSALSGESGSYDLDAIMRVVFVVAAAVVVLNLVADVALVWLDPRITGRSGSRPVWRAPDGGLRRRRIALVLTVVAAAVAAGSVAAARSGGGAPVAGLDLFGRGAKPLRAALSERIVTSAYTVDVRIDDLAVGPNGWTARVQLVDRSPGAMTIPVLYTQNGFSVGGFTLVSYATQGYFKAAAYEPPLPVTLAPGKPWTARVGGSDHLPRGVALNIDFGMIEPANGARAFTLRTTKTLTLP
jgi:hypothetical protein